MACDSLQCIESWLTASQMVSHYTRCRYDVGVGVSSKSYSVRPALELPVWTHDADLTRRRPGADLSRRGPGADLTRRGPGADLTRPGPGADLTRRGPGADLTRRRPGADLSRRGPGADLTRRGPGADLTLRGPGADLTRRGPGADLTRRRPGADLTWHWLRHCCVSAPYFIAAVRTHRSRYPLLERFIFYVADTVNAAVKRDAIGGISGPGDPTIVRVSLAVSIRSVQLWHSYIDRGQKSNFQYYWGLPK